MPQKKLTFTVTLSDGTTQDASVIVPVGVDKQKWVGLSTENSPLLQVDNIQFSFIPGSSSATGLAVSCTEGSPIIDGFHWCLFGTNSYSNYQINNLTLTTVPNPLPDTGITESLEWRKMWFWVQGVENTTMYHAELFKRGTKIVLQVWKE